MKDGFTLIEVTILFIIFLVVAVLIIPLSIDDVVMTKNIDRWKQAQLDFSTIPICLMNSDNYKSNKPLSVEDFMGAMIKVFPLKRVMSYKIKYLNGDIPTGVDRFEDLYATNNGATIGFIWLGKNSIKEPNSVLAKIIFDVNGKSKPNVWGKDVFGMNIYGDKVLPFGSELDKMSVELDCSRQGTGKACSSYYLKEDKE